MRALSIRQPYAEMILRGEKTIEYRSRPTKIIGETFYIYAAKKPGELSGFAALGVPVGSLPTGVIVGTAKITHSTKGGPSGWQWHLTDVQHIKHPRRPRRQPQPVWFSPF